MKTWTQFKAAIANRVVSLQYEEDSYAYVIRAFDPPMVLETMIYKGSVPALGADGFEIDQSQNDLDEADWETNYKPYANRPLTVGEFDPRIIRKLGNLTSASVSEVLLSLRPYNEPASQMEMSIKSSNAADAQNGAGIKAVRICYLTSAYVRKEVDVSTHATNGTTAVRTVVTDMRFIESMRVIQGAAAVGAVELFPSINGTGTAVCGIGAGTEDAFLCHHYVPAGMRCFVRRWGVTCNDDVNAKLRGQARYGALGVNLVDTTLDLDNLTGVTTGARAEFARDLRGVMLGEKTYVRLTVVPGQVGSTITRGFIELFEDKAIL